MTIDLPEEERDHFAVADACDAGLVAALRESTEDLRADRLLTPEQADAAFDAAFTAARQDRRACPL